MDFKFATLDDDTGRMAEIANMSIKTINGEICDRLNDDTDFEIGDIVRLITGSPEMVIISIGDMDVAEVCWYDDFSGLNIEALPLEALYNVIGGAGDDG